MQIARRSAVSTWAACALLALAGCGRTQVQSLVAASNDSNIKRATNLYYAFVFRNYGLPPSDEASLRAFVRRDMGPKKLEMMGVDPNNLDAVFKSERDGKPFKVKYGLGGNSAVVFEQDGKDGKRLVGFANSVIQEVDDTDYQTLWEQKAPSRPPPIGTPTPPEEPKSGGT